ncbi:MAG: hypothetical protein ACRD2F_03580 [Terriglobales bacterium]
MPASQLLPGAAAAPNPALPTVGAPLPVITPYAQPVLLGLPSVNWLDTFQGEACYEAKTYYRIPLTSGESDAVQILRILNKLILDYAGNPCVIGFAQCLVQTLAVPNDKTAQLAAVVNFMSAGVVYQADPNGIEYVRSPVQMLRDYESNGLTRGDCDDQVLLVGALLGALGITVQAIGLRVAGSATFNHVIAQINRGGTWQDYDPCNPDAPWTAYGADRLIPAP